LPSVHTDKGLEPKAALFNIDGFAADIDDYYHVMRDIPKGMLFSNPDRLLPLLKHILMEELLELDAMVHEHTFLLSGYGHKASDSKKDFIDNLKENVMKKTLRFDFIGLAVNQDWKNKKPSIFDLAQRELDKEKEALEKGVTYKKTDYDAYLKAVMYDYIDIEFQRKYLRDWYGRRERIFDHLNAMAKELYFLNYDYFAPKLTVLFINFRNDNAVELVQTIFDTLRSRGIELNLDLVEQWQDCKDPVIKVYIYFFVYGNKEKTFMGLVKKKITDPEALEVAEMLKMAMRELKGHREVLDKMMEEDPSTAAFFHVSGEAMKVESVNWAELDEVGVQGTLAVGEIRNTIKLLMKNKGVKLKKVALLVEVPLSLAREITKEKTVEAAFELWRMTYLKKAFKALKKGVDIDKVKAKTNLSTSALEFLKSVDEMPEKGKELKLLKRFAYMEDYLGELKDYIVQ
jgi:hypothetical protein